MMQSLTSCLASKRCAGHAPPQPEGSAPEASVDSLTRLTKVCFSKFLRYGACVCWQLSLGPRCRVDHAFHSIHSPYSYLILFLLFHVLKQRSRRSSSRDLDKGATTPALGFIFHSDASFDTCHCIYRTHLHPSFVLYYITKLSI